MDDQSDYMFDKEQLTTQPSAAIELIISSSISNDTVFNEFVAGLDKDLALALIDSSIAYSQPLPRLFILYRRLCVLLPSEKLDIFLKKYLMAAPRFICEVSSYKMDDEILAQAPSYELREFSRLILEAGGVETEEAYSLISDWKSATSLLKSPDGVEFLSTFDHEKKAVQQNIVALLSFLAADCPHQAFQLLSAEQKIRLAIDSGIRVFARHKPETIVNNIFAYHGQDLEPANLVGREAVVNFISLADWNGALNKARTNARLISDIKRLEPAIDVVIIDATWSGFHRHLAIQRQRRNINGKPYRQPQPWIKYLILAQHGTPTSICVNVDPPLDKDDDGRLKMHDISRWNKDPSLDLLPGAEIIIFSCSTGKITDTNRKSVIDGLSSVSRRRSTGPVEDSRNSRCAVYSDGEGVIKLKPVYWQVKSRTARPRK